MNPDVKAPLVKWVRVLIVAGIGLLCSNPAAVAAHSVVMEWDAATDAQVVGYRLYYGTTSAKYSQCVDVGALTSVTLAGLTGGSTYYSVVTCYNAAGTESLPSDEISFATAADSTPVVNLVSPGDTINGPATVTLSAAASVDDASITQIEFYAGSTRLGVATNAPYQMAWNNAPPGSYQLSAVAYDSNGVSAVSAVVPVNIVSFGVTKLERGGDGNYQLTATGAPGSTCSVYVSEDLVNWRLLKTVTNSTGTVTVSDDTSSQVPRRFYKLASD